MLMSRFFASKHAASRPKRKRSIRFEPLEGRRLLAGDSLGEGELSADPVPDFQLVDVNPNSATFNTPVSPRDLLGQAGAVYFAHST